MTEETLSPKAIEALKFIRSFLMRFGKVPPTRELMNLMAYKSPRSAMLLLMELETNGFLQRKPGGSFRLMKDLTEEHSGRTVEVPLLGSIACGAPIYAYENVEAMIPVSTTIARPGASYFFLRARGNSMDRAGILEGDLVLVKQQQTAQNGQQVVALIDDEATVKEYYHQGAYVMLVPNSYDESHQPIILTTHFQIQGIVIATIPKLRRNNYE